MAGEYLTPAPGAARTEEDDVQVADIRWRKVMLLPISFPLWCVYMLGQGAERALDWLMLWVD